MEIYSRISRDNVKFVQLQFTDIFGIVKSVTIPAQHVQNSFENGTYFDGSSIEGFTRIAESDMYLKPDQDTYAVIPWNTSADGNTARFICDVYRPSGEPFEGDPRQILKKVITEAEEEDLKYNTGPELEFFLFKKENGAKPIPHDMGGYFDLSTDRGYEVRKDMSMALGEFGIDVEASHHEVATGQHEIDFKYTDVLKTADNAVTFRVVLKEIAKKHGLHATFMPKPITGINGSGMHVHQSLLTPTGVNLFFDRFDKYKLSSKAYKFLAGQLKHIKGMSAILSPTVNSYKRLVPGHEAPIYISWARMNRSALIRVPVIAEDRPRATRIELRCPDPSCNIYLAFAVMLKAGLDGIKNNLEPPTPIEEDIYNLKGESLEHIDTLPTSLGQALEELKKNELVKEALGIHTYERYIEAKTKEWDDYRIQVTPWELERYLETY